MRLSRPHLLDRVAIAGALVLVAGLYSRPTAQEADGPFNRQVKLIPQDGSTPEALGISVSISVDTAIVGAAGSAYILQRDLEAATGWTQVARLGGDLDPRASGCGTVAISGDTALLG